MTDKRLPQRKSMSATGKLAQFTSILLTASVAVTCLTGFGAPTNAPVDVPTPAAAPVDAPTPAAAPVDAPTPAAEDSIEPSVTGLASETAAIPVPAASQQAGADAREIPTDLGTTPEPEPTPEAVKTLLEEQGTNGARMGLGAAMRGMVGAKSLAAPLASGPWTPSTGVLGMDVSGHQPSVNWSAEAAKGAKFSYVKASEGITMTSDHFSSQYIGSRNVGMLRGAYHFALPSVSSGAVQADFFVNNGGGWSADGWTLPPLLDIEYNPYSSLGNACFNMSQQQMVSWIRDFSNRVLLRVGRLPMIYTTTDWWRSCTGNNPTFGANGLHIAAYNQRGPEPLPAGWANYQMWQFSDAGPFAGDSNVWNGSLAQLKQFASQFDGMSSTTVGDISGDGKNDMVSVRADGGLWFHAGTGTGTFAAATRIGNGWNVYSQLVGPGDVDGDGRHDLLGVRADGSMWFYAGTGSTGGGNSGFAPGRKIDDSTWNQFTKVVAARDVNADRKNDLVATKPDGSLWLFTGLGTINPSGKAFAGPVKVGTSSWDTFTNIDGAGDLNSDGIADLLAVRADGTLWLYAGTGSKEPVLNAYSAALKIGTSGWNQFNDVLGAGDLNGDGKPDILGIRPDGTHFFYAGTGMKDNGYLAARKIGGSGWDGFKQVLASGDLDSDGIPDLLAVEPKGSLWLYLGDRMGGYKPRISIGSSWQVYATVIGVGDINSDSKPDLLGIRPDGTLWFYAGNGAARTGDSGFAPAVKVGTYWNTFTDVVAVGDMNVDGKSDLLATRSDGSLWFYAGVGKVSATNSGFAAGKNLGKQDWVAKSRIAGSLDIDSNGIGDVLSVDTAGALSFRSGTGSFSTGTGLKSAIKIGSSGWNAYKELLGVGDADQNGRNDLVGVNRNGSLWFYSGTGMRSGPLEAGVNKGQLR